MKQFFFLQLIMLPFLAHLQINQVDAKGRKQGVWEKKFPNSQVYQYKGQFKDDKPVGTFIYYHENNKVSAILKHQPNSNRTDAVYYHDNGKVMSIGHFIAQKKDSVWKNYGPSERITSIETFKNGELHGPRIVYYVPQDINSKVVKVAIESNYVNGKLDGKYTEYFDIGGVKKMGEYKLNKKIGEWVTNNPNGTKLMLDRYKDGVPHGWQVAYNSKGVEVGKKYYYYGKNLVGKELETKLKYLKEHGINPNE